MRIHRILMGAGVTLMLAGCASTDGFLGLASKGYVDRQLAVSDERTQQGMLGTEERVNDLADKLDGYGDVRDQVDYLLLELQRMRDMTRELQDLAMMVQRRVDTIPDETLRQLIIILQDHLDRNRSYASSFGDVAGTESRFSRPSSIP